ncbi:hypothetical protein H6G33_24720 [Calothrix sp. FACHB-1219]|uniref:hypothetical protein n=1 Tax=unclassified Calothrix TaxID=2619626 RepID=UPI0016893181|nr:MULTISPECIES: hypothetical protein [unclassified Calothrix]MBD2205549.1 hypothetical protein [Calothrix sp. FACHB-168]MBD2220212.1 hypothetical protein [Calothrix sp. FACHB-1219]
MADVTADINQSRAMRIAQRRVEGFAQQFGEAHRNLARHAAFPLVLTPDLLYQIWANFLPQAPWVAVAHVLLSRLCRQVGYEMYEMDISDRNLLLRELKEEFGQERFDELGEFLLDYVAQRLTDDDADTQDLRQAQEWTALAYTKPDEAAQELAQALNQRVEQKDIGEVLRLNSLFETLAEPLLEAGFTPLLVYSKAMAAVSHGEQQGIVSKLNEFISIGNKQLGKILSYLYGKLEQDVFIEFINENYDCLEDLELLLSAIYKNEYLDFESFVELAIQTLKPDFDGNVFVKYNRYWSTYDEGERIRGVLDQQAVQIHLNQVLEFITETDGESLGVNLDQEQEIEMVLAILSSGEYELPESDIEEGTVEISIKEPKLLEDSYQEYENGVYQGENVDYEKNVSLDLDKEVIARGEKLISEATLSINKLINVIYLNHNLIFYEIESELSSMLHGRTVTSFLIPNDNNEGTIDEVEQIEEINFNFNNVENYGSYFVIPFNLIVQCKLTYFIYKADYYAMGDEEDSISILDDDWNDHHFWAGQDYSLMVEGFVSVHPTSENITSQDISDDEAYEIIENSQISIDSLTTVEIIGS